jgi:parallel beta-helix repeat protein
MTEPFTYNYPDATYPATVGVLSADDAGAVLRVYMTAAWQEDVQVTEGSGLVNKLNWVRDNGEPGKNYVITVTRDEAIAPYTFTVGTFVAPTGFAGACVTLESDSDEEERTISSNGNDVLFSMQAASTAPKTSLVLGKNITLQGRSGNTASVIAINANTQVTMLAWSKITGNTKTNGVGAGVYVNGGTFVMHGGKISENICSNSSASSAQGGGVYVTMSGGAFIMTGGTITGNKTTGNGAGVYVTNSATFTMLDGIISNNKITGGGYSGGGVWSGGTFTMSGGAITGNEATGNGGGVYVNSSTTFTMSNSTISGNKALCTVTGNYGNGGGVYSGGTFTMPNSEISDNEASHSIFGGGRGNGGGVFTQGGVFTMSNSKISRNKATDGNGEKNGGGVCLSGASGTFIMLSGEISGNEAAAAGGAVYVNGGAFMLQGGTLSGNTANYGGAVYLAANSNACQFTMSDGVIRDSTAQRGGGVYVATSDGANKRFIKTGGTIYGDTNNTHTPGADENTALAGDSGYGHAAYYTKTPAPVIKYRDTDAGPAVRLDTNDSTGWE